MVKVVRNEFMVVEPDRTLLDPVAKREWEGLVRSVIPQGLDLAELHEDVVKIPPDLTSFTLFHFRRGEHFLMKTKIMDPKHASRLVGEMDVHFAQNPEDDELQQLHIRKAQYRGVGIAKPMLLGVVNHALSVERKHLKVAAGDELGGPVWLIYGFEMYQHCWDNPNLKKSLEDKVKYYAPEFADVLGVREASRVVNALLVTIRAGDLTSANLLARNKIPVTPFATGSKVAPEHYDASAIKTIKEGKYKGKTDLGIMLFAGEQWEGALSLDLKSPGLQSFYEYTADTYKIIDAYEARGGRT